MVTSPGRQAHEVGFHPAPHGGTSNGVADTNFRGCDVAAAFDHVSHHVIIGAMEALKVPPVFVAAWIRECRGSETFAKLDDIMTPGIRRTRSVPRGDASAPDLFGAALDIQGTAFCERCQTEKWGLPLREGNMGLLLFADNCWIIAMSPAEIKCMARAWYELLEKAGLRIAWGEAVWCSSAPDSLEATITVSDTVVTRRSREQGFKALGAWITFDGHFMKEIAEREVIAWRSFHAIRHLLCENKVALKHRLRLLSSCVASSMYWCSGSWILTLSRSTHL